jgi:hypothetical protein
MTRSVTAALATLALASAAALASSTAAWEMNSYQDFVRGTFSGVSLSRDGRMSLAPRMDTWFSSDQPAIWAVAAAPDGSLYLGSGHHGRLFRVDKTGKSSVVWSAREPEIFGVAVAPDGSVFAGTSPDGKIYRIRGGKAEEYFAPGAKYIWSLAVGRDGALFVGTGDGGRIFRVTGPGKGEVWYETGQTHITSLAIDAEGRLLAGSEPNGVLYRVTGKDRAFVLYDADLPEIRTIVPGPDGAIYAAALGGSVAQRAGAAANAAGAGGATPAVTAPTTSITVTDEAQTGLELKPKAEAPKPAQATTSAVSSYTQPTELIGVEKSAVYRINTDNTVEKLWSSKDENAYDLLLSGDSVLFSTDAQGRIYRLTPDRRLTLVAQTNEGETTRLLSFDGSLLAATGTMGKLFRLTEAAGSQGYYESPVHDAGTVARWGQLSWRADKPSDARLVFRTRSGNSARPDKTWSDWSAPVADPRAAAITSPNARFLQWRAEFASNSGVTPVLTSVGAAYLPQNTPPVVKAVTVTTQLAAPPAGSRQAGTTAAPASTGVYSVTVTDSGDAGPATSAGTPTQVVGRGLSQQIVISWQAEDPDGDRLVYAVWFRADEDNQWKLLRSNFAETSLTLEGDVFADGKYFFRVVASDKPANTASTAREGEMVSPPVLFDSTPPLVTASSPRRSGSRLEVEVTATDAASPLRHAEYSIDANGWVPLESADGIVDGQTERFTLRMENLAAGEHLVVIRVYDSSNNAGLAKVLVR